MAHNVGKDERAARDSAAGATLPCREKTTPTEACKAMACRKRADRCWCATAWLCTSHRRSAPGDCVPSGHWTASPQDRAVWVIYW